YGNGPAPSNNNKSSSSSSATPSAGTTPKSDSTWKTVAKVSQSKGKTWAHDQVTSTQSFTHSFVHSFILSLHFLLSYVTFMLHLKKIATLIVFVPGGKSSRQDDDSVEIIFETKSSNRFAPLSN